MFFYKFFKKISFAQIIYGCAWVLVMGLFSTHAQAKCSVSVSNDNKIPLKNFVARTPGSPAAPLFKQTVTATYTNCDAPISDLTFSLAFPLLFTKGATQITSSGTTTFFDGWQLSCSSFSVQCTDINNTTLPGNVGISYTAEANIFPSCGATGNISSSSSNTSIKVTTGSTVCNSFNLVYQLTFFRGSDQIPSTLSKVKLSPLGSFGIMATSLADTTLSFSQVNLLQLNKTFSYGDGTCALGFNPSSVNLGNFLLNAVQSTPVNSSIPNSSKNVTITISNCTGFALGTKKVFLVQFNKPRATDSTLMDNELSSAAGGNTGVSARITADSRLDASTKAALSPVVKSGEFFITSAGTSDSKNMTYTVEFVRNSDTATTGAFSSSAVFTMSYQ